MVSTDVEQDLLSTGIGGLDHILGGGLPRRTIVLVQGASGAGKTTAALQFLLAGAAAAEKCLLLSVAQAPDEIETLAQSHDLSLDGVALRHLDLAEGSDQYSVNTNEAQLDGLIEQTLAAVDEIKPDRLVFDSLLELRLLAPDEIVYRRTILNLKLSLTQREITAYIIDHMPSDLIDRQVEGLVHGVIGLEIKTPQMGTSHRRLRVKKFRAHSFVDGYHDYKILSGGLEVYPRVIPRELPPMQIGPTQATDIVELDRMLGGGLDAGATTLISGQSGTGKSTLATLFASSAARDGHNAGLFLFEERPEVYRDRSDGVGLGVSELERAGRLRLHHFDPPEITPGEFSNAVLSRVEQDNLELVVIDSLTGYVSSLPDAIDVVGQIQALLQFLSRSGLVVILVSSQHGLLGEEPRSDLDVSYLADSVILLRHAPSRSEIRRSIAVMKKRHTNHARSINSFVIAPGQVAVEPLSPEGLDSIGAN